MKSRIMIVDDDPDFLEVLYRKVGHLGYQNVSAVDDPLAVLEQMEAGQDVDLALLDMSMPQMDGIELLERIKHISPGTECIMVTAVDQARVAVECIRKGAYDYLLKPVDDDVLSLSIQRAMERKRLLDVIELDRSGALPTLADPAPFQAFVTRSREVLKVLREAELHAQSNVPILITGESGTGKELLARAIHGASRRSHHPFTPINMASVTGNLFEAEFFGHVRGAFTGAEQDRVGYLEHTHQGTLFLDEISDLPLELQGKLLRVLQDGIFTRVGSNRPQKADIRLVAATNEDLNRMIQQKRFRKDLYYRIRGGWLQLPPLRSRPEDIPVLVDHFLRRTVDPQKAEPLITESALSILTTYDYPGNVRELKTILQSAVNLAQGAAVSTACLPPHVKIRAESFNREPCAIEEGSVCSLATVEKAHILDVYAFTGRNKSRTARLLGIGLNTLRRKLKIYGET